MSYMVGSQFVSMTVTGDAERSGDDADGEDDCDGSWRRFSAREVARMMGFPESFVLSRDGAHQHAGERRLSAREGTAREDVAGGGTPQRFEEGGAG